jgi:hypothetical protein
MRRARSLLAAGVAALALAVAAAGCGGGDETAASSTTTTTSGASGASGAALSKEEFIAQADRICKGASDQIKAEASGILSPSSSPNEIAAFTTRVVIPTQQATIDQIRTLKLPAGDEDEVNTILDAVDAALQRVEDDPALQADPQAADAEFDDANQLARDYGLVECGS